MRLWKRRYASKEDTNLGRVLIRMRACTAEQVAEARARQEKLDGILLGEILIEMDALTTEVLAEALRLQGMMRNGKAAEAMLEIVEHHTKKAHKRITGTFPAVA